MSDPDGTMQLMDAAKAVVLCVDEKTQSQALDRTAPILPILPIRPGVPEKQTHDYVGHGTTTLLAALAIVAALFPEARAR